MMVLENKRMHVTDRKLPRVSCLHHGASFASNGGHAASAQFLKNSVFRSHFERTKAKPFLSNLPFSLIAKAAMKSYSSSHRGAPTRVCKVYSRSHVRKLSKVGLNRRIHATYTLNASILQKKFSENVEGLSMF